MKADLVLNIIIAATQIILLVGLIAAFAQAKAAYETIVSQNIFETINIWMNLETYVGISHIHNLREKWKEYPITQWGDLAKKWVEEEAPKDPKSQEWMMRRTVSQFLSNLGIMIRLGYVKPDQVFSIIPEVGRLLIVLIPIDIEIQKYYEANGGPAVAEFDHPIPKYELNNLMSMYIGWYNKNKDRLVLEPIDPTVFS